ncbi:MAG: TRAP transporter substrate-binding protein, partial [Planctomycetota bacterium]|nr:TRAP transporter substrate-binding protein [Planctomycetota bacterium]
MKGILSLMAVLVATAGLALAGQAPKSLKLGYAVVPGGPIHDAAIRFGELVKEKSGGSLEIELFHSAALGNEREMCEGLMVGMQDLLIVGAAPISWYIPEYGMIEAPFIFRDYEHMDKVFKGDVGKEIAERLYAKNKLIIIDWWHRGPRYLTTSTRRVESPADLRGLKLRVPEVPAYIATWRLLGANTTPITYSEMFMALKQGVV